jgi:tetratricopeptide (TPR) repeat protein
LSRSKKKIEKNKPDTDRLSVQNQSKYKTSSYEIKETPEKKNPGKKNLKARWWFYLILMIIPLLFFIIIEASLRFFDYGFDNRLWIEATKEKLLLNPEIAKRYFFTTTTIPQSNQDIFDANKKPNTFRVFVLGESSAAGYPFSPLGSFSRYLRDRLKLIYPSKNIEVINLGLTAINSFALRDIFPGVLEQKPDLVLIYTGHNEYYGALGIGSMESLSASRDVVNLILYMNRFKTIELLRNIISGVIKIFSSEDRNKSGTLMSRMAKEQYIGLDSEVYAQGILQFEENMQDILEMAKEKKVPAVLSTLTSNLKDQPPFISIQSEKLPRADSIYKEAKNKLSSGNFREADSLFRYAKDLDGLRFRAPEKINDVIKSLGSQFNFPVINIDSVFASLSPDGITGNNIMTDHLHPTLHGYFLIGKIFFNEMKENNFLPGNAEINLSDKEQDSITVANFNFTKLDSVISNLRIRLLKNDWPFVEKQNQLQVSEIFSYKNIVDSMAVAFMNDKIIWEEAHRKLAAYYLRFKNIDSFLEEMDALISQYPVVFEYYDFVSNTLISLTDYDRAYEYLEKGYEIKPQAFTAKWLGTINLFNNKLDLAEKYLKESLAFEKNDAQVWYNLAGVYVRKNNYKTALENVNKALALKPNYPDAINLQQQLLSVINSVNK